MANGNNDNRLFFNGVNGATGQYGLPPMTEHELSGFIQGEGTPENLAELKFRHQQANAKHLGVREGVDPKKLAEAGWGVIFAFEDGDQIDAHKDALKPLLALREDQASGLYKEYVGPDALRPGESKGAFLARHGMGPGPADPGKIPYYLLLVGSPERIPYRFQSQLDVQYAVGRLHFDSIEGYANYAQSVVAAETKGVELARDIGFFGVANTDDRATGMSCHDLVAPLVSHVQQKHGSWQVKECLEGQATKSKLIELLGGSETPALLFTASHGMEFPKGDPRQLPHQGALLCQDWPGPNQWNGEIPQDYYFAGDDLTSDASLLGLIAFHFACYGGGTPKLDEFAKQAFKDREEIAPYGFLASLPKSLLSHSKGGALAAIAHVERAWGYSFRWEGAGPQTVVFESALDRLLDGHPVGSALEYFDERYAELSSDLSVMLEDAQYGAKVDEFKLAAMWTANNDARGYIIIGDPAIRLPVAQNEDTPSTRPVLDLKEIPKTQVSNEPSSFSARASTTATSSGDEAAVEFGLRETTSDIGRAVKEALRKLAVMLTEAADNMTTLEVHTYTSSDLSSVTYDPKTKRFNDAAKLRASTRISLDGDLVNLVPERRQSSGADGERDVNVEIHERLWAIHREMVAQAQENKVAFVQSLVETAARLMKAV